MRSGTRRLPRGSGHGWVVALAALALGAVCGANPAQATLLFWDIDSSLSSLTLNVPDQNVTLDGTTVNIRLRNANNSAWTQGRTAPVDGILSTNYVDGVSIQFLAGQQNAFGLTTGNFRPNPADFNPALVNVDNPNGQFVGTGTAPAVYAAKVRGFAVIFTFDLGFVSFLDTSYDIGSGILPIGVGGAFAGNALSMGVQEALIAFDGVNVALIGSQPVADSPGGLFGPFLGTNNLAGASVTSPDPIGDPTLRRLSIPVNLPLAIVLEGVPLNATVTGSIVAFAYVPEAATLLLVASGLAGLLIFGRRAA